MKIQVYTTHTQLMDMHVLLSVHFNSQKGFLILYAVKCIKLDICEEL